MAHLRPTPLTTNIRVHARQLDLEPALPLLPRHPRPLLRGVEQAHRSALAHHVHRPARLGLPVLITRTWYKAPRQVLSVCPGTSCGIAEPSQHEADRGKAEEGERLAVEVLPILSQPTAAVQPSDGAFDNPALREDDKPFRLIRALHDFKGHAPQDLFDRTSELRSLVSAI